MEDKRLTEETVEKLENSAEEAAGTVEEAAAAETAETAENLEEASAETAENLEEAAAETAENLEEAAAETAENLEEAAAETAESLEEAAADPAGEIPDEAEEISENAGDEAEDAGAETEEKTESAEENAEDAAAEDASGTDDTSKPAKKGAVKEPPIIKKKRKLDKVNVIVIVVCAVIVLACLAFVGIKLGWFKGKVSGKMQLEDYSTIEVLNEDVDIPDEIVDQYIENLLQSQSTTEEVTEGTVEDGDQLNIDFVGKLKETGEEFDGGSATGQSLTIGSGTMIDGFESSLIGAEIGKTTTISVTFPEDYSATDLAGKDATFDVTVNSKSVTSVPELTDDFVKDYSSNYLEKQLNTVDELKEYVHDYLYNYYLHSAMFEELEKKENVISYDEEKEAMLMDYSMQSLDYYAAMYGTTADQYAAMYGAADAEEYAKQEADYYLDTIMLVDQIIKDKNITWTEDEFLQSVALYMARQGYSELYSVDEFLEQSGDTWRYLYENLEFKYELAMKALEPNVVFVDQKSDAEEESLDDDGDSEEIVIDESDLEDGEIVIDESDLEDGEIVIDGSDLEEVPADEETESAAK